MGTTLENSSSLLSTVKKLAAEFKYYCFIICDNEFVKSYFHN